MKDQKGRAFGICYTDNDNIYCNIYQFTYKCTYICLFTCTCIYNFPSPLFLMSQAFYVKECTECITYPIIALIAKKHFSILYNISSIYISNKPSLYCKYNIQKCE